MPNNGAIATAITASIQRRLAAAARKAALAAGQLLAVKAQAKLAVPAPRQQLPGGDYRATTRAAPPPTPPRRVGGRLQARTRAIAALQPILGARVLSDARSREGFAYGPQHEYLAAQSKRRPFVAPAAQESKAELKAVIVNTIVKEINR